MKRPKNFNSTLVQTSKKRAENDERGKAKGRKKKVEEGRRKRKRRRGLAKTRMGVVVVGW
jgi:hypothetical protein